VDVSTAFADDVSDAHSEAMATNPNSTTADTEIGGQTFGTGTHHFESTVNIASGTVTLDGKGDSNAQFLFIAGSTLVTGADTSVILINEAKAENVLWVLGRCRHPWGQKRCSRLHSSWNRHHVRNSVAIVGFA
jgi:hypothetical protein